MDESERRELLFAVWPKPKVTREGTGIRLKAWRWLTLGLRCTRICRRVQGKIGECTSCQQINTQTTSGRPASWLNECRKPLKEHLWAQLYLLLHLLLLTSRHPSTPGLMLAARYRYSWKLELSTKNMSGVGRHFWKWGSRGRWREKVRSQT